MNGVSLLRFVHLFRPPPILLTVHFVFEMMNFVVQMMNLALKNDGFFVQNDGFSILLRPFWVKTVCKIHQQQI